MDRGAWRATVRRVSKSQTQGTEHLRTCAESEEGRRHIEEARFVMVLARKLIQSGGTKRSREGEEE